MKYDQLAEHITSFSQLSFRMESERYDSLLSSSGRLLTCISISMVALMSLLPILLDAFPGSNLLIGLEYLGVFAVIIASFVCALIAQFRFKYQELSSPSSLAQFVLETADSYDSDLVAACNFADSLETPYRSIKDRNARITRLLIASSILLWVALGMIIFLSIIDVIVLIL